MFQIRLLLSFVIMHVLVDFAGIYYLLAQVLTTGIVMLSNYLLSASWVFSASDSK